MNRIQRDTKIAIFLICLFFSHTYAKAIEEVIINEIMPNNVNTIFDEDYYFPESWVELFNTTDQDINIKGWYLSSKKKNLTMWKIPTECTIPARGYKIIYLDKKDYYDGTTIHSNFSLDNKQGTLYLTQGDGLTIEDMTERYEDAPINLSFGRCPSSDKWLWFRNATPNKKNEDDCTEKNIAPDVTFSPNGGIFDHPMEITLNAPQEYKNDIHYTIDGSEPTIKSPQYNTPISIEHSTSIRAKIINDDILSQTSQTNSYLILDREIKLPILSITIDPNYLWDDTMGIYNIGKTGYYDDFLGEYANFRTNRRRPINLEYFTNGGNVINQICEVRLSGGYTRVYDLKSFKIYAKSKYGNNHFNYQIFKDKTSQDPEGYKSFMLRNGGNDVDLTTLKDAYCQYLSGKKVNIDYQACQSTAVFINGEYWGIENIRENDNEDFCLSNYGTDDVDLYENYKLKAGTTEEYNQLYDLLSQETIDHDVLCSMVDVDEFINYMSLEAFVGNYDWPSNNHVFWRKRDNGKWRWIVKDLDGGFTYWQPSTNSDISGVNLNPFRFLSRTEPCYHYGNNEKATFILERILSDPIIQRQYIERIATQLGDIFHKSEFYKTIDSLNSIIVDEIPFHKERWNQSQTTWDACINQMPMWIEYRNDNVYHMMSDYYSLGDTIPLTIASNIYDPETKIGNLSLCGQKLHRDRFDGKWFQNDSLRVKADSIVGDNVFSHWSLSWINSDNKHVTDSIPDLNINIQTKENHALKLMAIYTHPNESTQQDSTYISPIPTQGNLSIKFYNNEGMYTVTINDMLGRVIKIEEYVNDEIVIDLSDLKIGIYFITISNSTQKFRKKIIKI